MSHNNPNDLMEPENHAHDESNWLVSYADMMTLLFGFFVLMYSMSRIDTEKFKVVSKEIAEHMGGTVTNAGTGENGASPKKDPADKSGGAPLEQSLGQKGTAQSKDLADKMGGATVKDIDGKTVAEIDKGKALGNINQVENAKLETDTQGQEIADTLGKSLAQYGGSEGDIQFKATKEGIEVSAKGDFVFKSGSSEINQNTLKLLDKISSTIIATGRIEKVEIEGHTDAVPIKSKIFPTNWELSAARSSRVARYFIEKGIKPDVLVAQGFGDSRPKVENFDKNGKAIPENLKLNRRAVIKVKFAALHADKSKVINDPNVVLTKDDEKLQDHPEKKTVAEQFSETQKKMELMKQRLAEAEALSKQKKQIQEMEDKIKQMNQKLQEAQSKMVEKQTQPESRKPAAH